MAKRRTIVLVAALALLGGTAAASPGDAGSSLVDALQRELGLTRSAAEIQRGLATLDREQAGLQYSAGVLEHATRESMRRLAAYGGSQGDRRAQARRRGRALVKLARGGIARLAFAEALGDEPDGATALRLARAHALHAVVRHDLRELESHRRAEARARAELVAATRELQALGAVTTVFAMQNDVLAHAGLALDPALAEAAKERARALSRAEPAAVRSQKALVELVRENWRELDTLRGLGGSTRMRPPVPGPIVGAFGPYEDRVLRLPMTRTGIELAARRDDEVVAIAAGRVVLVTELPDYGGTVVVDHGGSQYSLVSRLWKIVATEGATVDAGAVLGRVAPKPIDDGLGATVYLELRHGEMPVDPAPYLRRAAVQTIADAPGETASEDVVSSLQPRSDPLQIDLVAP